MTPLAPIAAVAMAPDASWAVTVSADGTVRTRGTGVPSRLIRRAAPVDGRQPVAVALAGDRIRVLWADGATIRLHENVKGAFPRYAQFPVPAPVRALALSPSGVLAIAACLDGTLRVLNAGTGEFSPPAAAGDQTARAVAVAAEHGPVVVAFDDGSIRRYDLAARTWDLIGKGQGIALVAVSPDGATVIAASTGGYLLGWNHEGWGGFRELGAAATAIAVDGSGGIVLAGRADGTLWLYNMIGGATKEFGTAEARYHHSAGQWQPQEALPAADPVVRGGVTAGVARSGVPGNAAPGGVPANAPQVTPPRGNAAPGNAATGNSAPPDYARAAPPRSPGSAEPGGPAASLMDNDVRFTVYRPQAMSPGIWASLMVFAHKTDLVEEPGQPPLDPNERVEAIAREHFGSTPVQEVSEDARSGVLRGTRLRITVDLPGLLCNPSSAEFDWWEPVHHVVFRLLATPYLVGSVVRGTVRVWRGALILGEVSLAIRVIESYPTVRTRMVADSAARYRKIFPSYSHADGAIVDHVIDVASTLGNEYLRDAVALRVGERWRERLPQLIEEADIFQLFWSSNSMRSRYCREEWEYALSLGRPSFVLPTYWEDPRPCDPANGLPPPALDALHFVKMPWYAAKEVIPPAEPDRAPPTRDYPIPRRPASVPSQARTPEPPAASVPEPPLMEERISETTAPPTIRASPRPMPPPAPTQVRYGQGATAASSPQSPSMAMPGAARPRRLVSRRGLAVAALVLVVAVVLITVFLLRG